jgi:hypothetical protein
LSAYYTWAVRLTVSLLVLAALFAIVPYRQLTVAVSGVPRTLLPLYAGRGE